MPAHEPEGATTWSYDAKASITCSAMARAFRRSPELNAGWPQQVCGGTSTVQPASSRSFAAANPIEGRIRSTRQVTKRPTRARGSAMAGYPGRYHMFDDIGRKGPVPQGL